LDCELKVVLALLEGGYSAVEKEGTGPLAFIAWLVSQTCQKLRNAGAPRRGGRKQDKLLLLPREGRFCARGCSLLPPAEQTSFVRSLTEAPGWLLGEPGTVAGGAGRRNVNSARKHLLSLSDRK